MTDPALPPCPPWCAAEPGHIETYPGGWHRVHERRVGNVGPVVVSLSRWDDYEAVEGSVDALGPGVEVYGLPEHLLSPAEARELACLLSRAAEMLTAHSG